MGEAGASSLPLEWLPHHRYNEPEASAPMAGAASENTCKQRGLHPQTSVKTQKWIQFTSKRIAVLRLQNSVSVAALSLIAVSLETQHGNRRRPSRLRVISRIILADVGVHLEHVSCYLHVFSEAVVCLTATGAVYFFLLFITVVGQLFRYWLKFTCTNMHIRLVRPCKQKDEKGSN